MTDAPTHPEGASEQATELQAIQTRLTIQIGDIRNQPPNVRFFIQPLIPKTAELYPETWLLGLPGGNVNLDSGVDIPFPRDVEFPPRTLVKVGLGVRVRMLKLFWNFNSAMAAPPCGVPHAYALVPRSSIAKTHRPAEWDSGDGGRPQEVLQMPNAPGTIDVNYTGELIVQLYNPGNETIKKRRGDSVVQVIAPTLTPAECALCPADSAFSDAIFPQTTRGAGGFGSTGVGGTTAAAAGSAPS